MLKALMLHVAKQAYEAINYIPIFCPMGTRMSSWYQSPPGPGMRQGMQAIMLAMNMATILTATKDDLDLCEELTTIA